MRQIFIDGTGYYETMAMRTFDLPRENCEDKALDPTGTFSPRAMMKTGVLAFNGKPLLARILGERGKGGETVGRAANRIKPRITKTKRRSWRLMAKITLENGMVIEGTIEEFREMGVQFPIGAIIMSFYHISIPNIDDLKPQINEKFADILYNGSAEIDEDPADYYVKAPKGVRLA